jgi:serine/threonine protein phosphatase 1
MPARTIAIGYIHGCAAALRALVGLVELQAADTLVTLGDYIDRGPDSRGVIDYLLDLEGLMRVVPILGNHELMLLDAIENPRIIGPWVQCGGGATMRSYGSLTAIPPSHLDFIQRCLRYYETPTHFFLHANYAADLALDEQPEYLLFWEHLHFHLPAPHKNGKRAIVGHTSQKTGEVLDLGHVVCIDTFCHGGGWLTAMDVENRRFWQVDRNGRPNPEPKVPQSE